MRPSLGIAHFENLENYFSDRILLTYVFNNPESCPVNLYSTLKENPLALLVPRDAVYCFQKPTQNCPTNDRQFPLKLTLIVKLPSAIPCSRGGAPLARKCFHRNVIGKGVKIIEHILNDFDFDNTLDLLFKN